jgi:hypothetical protein
VRLKGKAGVLGGERSGKAGGDRGQALHGRWSEEEERKEEAGRRQVGSERSEEGRGRARARWAEGGGVRELGCTSWAERRKGRGVGRGEREPARRGGEEQAGLGWKLGLLSYYFPFSFSNQLKSI